MMKIVFRDFINLLKEDNELDALLVELLFSMNIEVISRPQKGRQFGVDILAKGKDSEDGKNKLFIITVKRHNLTREVWDKDQYSLRQSLNEILDVYIPTHLTKKEKTLPIKVIAAFNGIIEQSVLPNWKSHIEKFQAHQIQLESWDIDRIAQLSEQWLFTETLLPKESTYYLRKALAFIDINDYDLSHVRLLYETILNPSKGVEKLRIRQKKLRLLNLCLGIIFKWSQQEGNIKNALLSGEKAVLLSWKYLTTNNLLNEDKIISIFISISINLQNIQIEYLRKTFDYCFVKDSINKQHRINSSEASFIAFEFIGIYATVGLGMLEVIENLSQSNTPKFNEILVEKMNELDGLCIALCRFIKNNPATVYPQYDEHCIDICLVLLLLKKLNYENEAREWIEQLIANISITFQFTKFFPHFYSNHDELINSHIHHKRQAPQSSILLACIAEWCIVLNSEKLYSKLYFEVERHFKQVNLQLWFPIKNVEKKLFEQNANDEGKTKHSIMLPKNYLEYEMEMAEELHNPKLIAETELSIYKHGFTSLGLIASRHYRTLVFPYYWRSLLNSRFCFKGNFNNSP